MRMVSGKVERCLVNGLVLMFVGLVTAGPVYAGESIDLSGWASSLWTNISDVWNNFLAKLVALVALVATIGFLLSKKFMEAAFAFLAFLLAVMTSNLLSGIFGQQQ